MPRFTIDLSSDIDRKLTEIARANHISKGEVMRNAFALLVLAENEKKKGFSVGIVKESDDHSLEAVARVVGL